MGIWDSLTDIFTGRPAKDAADQNKQLLGQLQTTGTGYLDSGFGKAQGALQGSQQSLTALGQKYGAGSSLYMDALGINGAQGAGRASGAFTAGPGYNFNMDQGLEAINRRRAAGGMLDSGNADRDAQTFGAGLASNEYDKWLGNLGSFTSPELAATQGAAGFGGQLAGLYQGDATSRLGLAQGITAGQADANNQSAQASLSGSGNLWNLGMNAAKLGVSLKTGGFGGAGGGGMTPLTNNPYGGPKAMAYTSYGSR